MRLEMLPGPQTPSAVIELQQQLLSRLARATQLPYRLFAEEFCFTQRLAVVQAALESRVVRPLLSEVYLDLIGQPRGQRP